MPKPRASTYPKHQRWRFIQRYISNDELIAFSDALVRSSGKFLNDSLIDLVAFLEPGTTDLEELKMDYWLKLWVNIMHQMGLGYTIHSDRDTLVMATDLAHFLMEAQNIRAYYYYWALKFQYPFSYPKHKHYIQNGIALQPIVLILQYLNELFRRTNDINSVFLTEHEISLFLMKSINNSQELITENCTMILENRTGGYSYEPERAVDGFEETANHFFSRGRLYIQNLDIISFKEGKITVTNNENMLKVQVFLSYRKPPVIFSSNSRDIRNDFFNYIYSNFDIDPLTFIDNIDSIKLHEEYKEQKLETIRRTKRFVDINPEEIAGSFSQRTVTQRNFQNALRKDVMIIYDGKCCVCGLDLENFLITSHIVPVKVDSSIAVDPRNCLLLCVLHDRAFENGYFSVDDDYNLINNEAQSISHQILVREVIEREGQQIFLPGDDGLRPLKKYLKRHRQLHGIT